MMKDRLCLLVSLVSAYVMASPSLCRAKPVSHDSIEWATANSDRVIVGKVIKVQTVKKHDVVTVEVHRTLRGDQEAKADDRHTEMTFVIQEYCSRYAQGWLKDELPMIFFLVKIDGAYHCDQLPDGFKWVLHDNGNGNSAVLLGKTNRAWPGTMDVFTRDFDYLTDPAVIVKYVGDYARSIPPNRILESITIEVPWNTGAYRKVFPPKYPGNAFYLRMPAGEQAKPQAGRASKANRYEWTLYVLGAVGLCICVWYVARRWLGRGTQKATFREGKAPAEP